MRLKFTIPVLLFGACTTVDEETTPSWFEGWSPVDDVPVQEVVATHFFSADLPEGVMTFGAISTEEDAVAITSGVASYTDGVSTVYASDGTSLYRLEPDTLALTHLFEFEDASGPVDGITSMHRVRIDGEEILFVRTTDTIRLLDVSALVLSSPQPCKTTKFRLAASVEVMLMMRGSPRMVLRAVVGGSRFYGMRPVSRPSLTCF